jgi:HK97 family phage major capsid protein
MLLSTNATNGTVKVSDIVDDYIWTDWDKSPILSRVRKVYVKGNYSVGYEASATGAVEHTEGANAPAEETLTLAYVDFVAKYFKKWIRVSDTVLALKGRAFLDYLFDEFGHQLAVALENATVAEIAASDLSAKVTNPIDNTASMAGFAALSDEATNPVVIISKANYAAIMNARTTAGSKIEDPFNGMEVLFNNTVTGMLVGDLDGVVANFPEGEDFKFIVDENTYAEQDLVKIVGKILAAIHLVRPNGFAVVTAE